MLPEWPDMSWHGWGSQMAMDAGELLQGRVGRTFKLKLLNGKSCPSLFFYPTSFGFILWLSQHVEWLPCRNPNMLWDHEFQSICLDWTANKFEQHASKASGCCCFGLSRSLGPALGFRRRFTFIRRITSTLAGLLQGRSRQQWCVNGWHGDGWG